VPRKCGCDYCCARGAEYVSKSGTLVEVVVRKRSLHRVSEHGSGQAGFHECAHCGEVVLVTVTIAGECFGALNANCLADRGRFPHAVAVNFSDQTPEQKLARWQQNWCCPVRFQYLD